MSADQLIALATFGLVFATLLLVWVTLRGIRSQLWVMTFSEYTRRYSEIMEALPFEARRRRGNFDLAALSAPVRERVLGAMRKYLNLCSEELYLHRKGRIDREAWSIWRIGIGDTVCLPCFQQAWTLLRTEYDYYPEFCAFMDSLVGESQLSEAAGMQQPESGSKAHVPGRA